MALGQWSFIKVASVGPSSPQAAWAAVGFCGLWLIGWGVRASAGQRCAAIEGCKKTNLCCFCVFPTRMRCVVVVVVVVYDAICSAQALCWKRFHMHFKLISFLVSEAMLMWLSKGHWSSWGHCLKPDRCLIVKWRWCFLCALADADCNYIDGVANICILIVRACCARMV